MRAPLDDPSYEPVHQPVDGQIPNVVAKWGPRSQLRWFRRFRREIGSQTLEVWDRFRASSEWHRGLCCWSCEEEPHGVAESGWCCCRDERMRQGL